MYKTSLLHWIELTLWLNLALDIDQLLDVEKTITAPRMEQPVVQGLVLTRERNPPSVTIQQ